MSEGFDFDFARGRMVGGDRGLSKELTGERE